ncbi:hypothetical protein JQ628_24805 [Bradyrhizobium lablabi]|uniref:hypothetical protein n=1 Tax=Bradyrhizobium lablabi TaxID=722472 RepID=UPI001BAB24E8|nr:hypothetical protein [Bradyrhizobium lablabi]MBR1124767.1 hypothetical protein [Bradyrhizobium lablabi]
MERIVADVAVFADIGTDPPSFEQLKGEIVVRLIRYGESTELAVAEDGSILETFGEQTLKHANFRALLASDRYGKLRDWSNKQRAYLEGELASAGSLIDLWGLINGGQEVDLAQVDQLLSSRQREDSTRVLLIDGPAGIGKTQFIVGLAGARAQRYSVERRPLILHVQSRGRTLSYLYDLIAFSLQRLRLEVTYDQVPVLAKHGLITVAIDGFDELADPDGYDLAWSQVNDLVELLRGSGSLILAGRETFIGRDRVLRDIASLREGVDEVSVLTLQPPSKGAAIRWLEHQGWTAEQVDAIEEFLEPSSLALRPFFLKTLSDREVATRLVESSSTSILSILMEAMIEREIDKFGEAVDRELSEAERRVYLRSFVGETARDMAENGSTSISDATLSWLVEVALPKEVSSDVTRILKARSQAIAFFTNDDRKGHRRFFHDKFYEYFLSVTLIDIVGRRETGKLLARNIFGSSLLETFGDVVAGSTRTEVIRRFLDSSIDLIRNYPPIDRTRKNLAALAIASLSTADLVDDFKISMVDIDECRFSGTASGGQLDSLVINQLDCRGGDLSSTEFKDLTILTLIADRETLLPDSIPLPMRVQDVTMSVKTLTVPEDVQRWVAEHLRNPPEEEAGLIPVEFKDHEAIKVLFKACRLRQYWLRRGDDMYATRILDNPYWPIIENALAQNHLLRVEQRQASGTDARFIHVRQAEDILSESPTNIDVRNMYVSLIAELRKSQ